jgi:hypothetical protein
VRCPQPDSHVFFRKALVYPNGDLLVVYEGVGDTPTVMAWLSWTAIPT